jgi:hypothetical protein
MSRSFLASILTAAMLTVLAGCWKGPSNMAPPPPQAVLSVVPATATVTSGRAVLFEGRVDGEPAAEVTWRVLEPGGGVVDADGTYHAPGSLGTFTVQGIFNANGGSTAAARVTVVAPPAGTISAPGRVLPGAVGLTAAIQPVPGSVYQWSIDGGKITAGTDGPAVTFEAGSGARVILTCKVSNGAGDTLLSSVEVPVVPPVVLTISPATATITAGQSMKFGYNITGGTTLGVRWSLGQPGAGSLDDHGGYLAPAVPGAYTVRVSSVDEPTVDATAAVKVVAPPPTGMVVPDGFRPGDQGLRAEVPEDTPGMTYAWEIEGGTITQGAGTPLVTFTAGDGHTLTVRCRITNEAGDSATVSRTLVAF